MVMFQHKKYKVYRLNEKFIHLETNHLLEPITEKFIASIQSL
jgi:hypothetical protein